HVPAGSCVWVSVAVVVVVMSGSFSFSCPGIQTERTVVRIPVTITQMDRSPVMEPGRIYPVGGNGAQRGLPMLEPIRHERADAARNRAGILRAAERLVAEH